MGLAKKLLIVSAITGLITTSSIANSNANMIKEGKKLFNSKSKANCFACHDVNGQKIDNPGSLGPKLVGLKYWNKKDLYDIIYDPYKTRSKINAMPAFGKNGVLTNSQINAVVAYLKTIK